VAKELGWPLFYSVSVQGAGAGLHENGDPIFNIDILSYCLVENGS
jgi:hypothetical protein